MGAVTTSQAFVPLLRQGQHKGRIINISSVVSDPGRLATHAAAGHYPNGTACCKPFAPTAAMERSHGLSQGISTDIVP